MTRSIDLPAPPVDVWAALTTPAELSGWFGARASFADVERGARLEFRWPEGVTRWAVVEEVVPRERLTVRWLPVLRRDLGLPMRATSTRVTFRLERTTNGTRLTVEETSLFESRALAVDERLARA